MGLEPRVNIPSRANLLRNMLPTPVDGAAIQRKHQAGKVYPIAIRLSANYSRPFGFRYGIWPVLLPHARNVGLGLETSCYMHRYLCVGLGDFGHIRW